MLYRPALTGLLATMRLFFFACGYFRAYNEKTFYGGCDMTMHGDQRMQDDRGRSGSGDTRRDFIKMFGAAAAGSVAGLLLPGAAEAEDALESLKNLALQDPE